MRQNEDTPRQDFEATWVASTKEAEALKGISVLVVDDHSFMRNLVERMLLDLGVATVHLASGAAQALTMIGNGLTPLDLVLCDLKMPDTDGFAFVAGLRAFDNPVSARLPVLILSGNATTANIEAAVELGIQGFIAKPITAATLGSHIAEALATRTANGRKSGE